MTENLPLELLAAVADRISFEQQQAQQEKRPLSAFGLAQALYEAGYITEPKLTKAEAGRLGAQAKWAACDDKTSATVPGRSKFMERFEKQVDPDGVLPAEERARLAAQAKSEHFAALARRRHGTQL